MYIEKNECQYDTEGFLWIYIYLSLLDNFEWYNGFWPRFGFIEADYDSLNRTERKSAIKYAKIIADNGIIIDDRESTIK